MAPEQEQAIARRTGRGLRRTRPTTGSATRSARFRRAFGPKVLAVAACGRCSGQPIGSLQGRWSRLAFAPRCARRTRGRAREGRRTKGLRRRAARLENVADGTVRTFRSLLHSVGIVDCEYVLLLEDNPARLAHFIDAIELHRVPARSNPLSGNFLDSLGRVIARSANHAARERIFAPRSALHPRLSATSTDPCRYSFANGQ